MHTQSEQTLDDRHPAQAIGLKLRTAREQAGVSVKQIAQTTRISTNHLNALEAGQFDDLPGVGYIPGFIRNYCQVVGVDADPYVSSFKAISNTTTPKPKYHFPAQALVPRVAGSVVAMFAVLFGLSVYVGWAVLTPDQEVAPELIASSISQIDKPELFLENNADNTTSEQPQNSISVAFPPTPSPQTLANATPPPQSSVPVDSSIPLQQANVPIVSETDSLDKTKTLEDSSQTELVAVDSSESESLELAIPQGETQLAAVVPEENTGLAGDNATLSSKVGAYATQYRSAEDVIIRATASAWIEVTRADGEVLVTKLMRDGDELVFSSEDHLFLSTGNAGGLRLEMSDIAAFDAGQIGEILRDLRLNREALQSRQNRISY